MSHTTVPSREVLPANVLPPGYKLLWYRIEKVLGRGGFGITYLAIDTNLERRVAIKEYLPLDFAARDHDYVVRPSTGERAATYAWGLKRFLNEARTLAKFSHPNIVRVHNVFEDNNTAYMALDYEQGTGLDSLMDSGRVSENWLLSVILPLLDGLEHVHAAGYIHRDIKPENILIRRDGSPVLLDFGSTRLAPKQPGRALTSLVTRGYAPCEQYQDGHGQEGPWTDIYALGATLYEAACGKPPVDAVTRVTARAEAKPEPLIPASKGCRGGFSPTLLRAVDRALGLFPQDRPQNISSWLADLPNPSRPRPSAPDRPRRPMAKVAVTTPNPRLRQATPTIRTGLSDRHTNASVLRRSRSTSNPGWLRRITLAIAVIGLAGGSAYLLWNAWTDYSSGLREPQTAKLPIPIRPDPSQATNREPGVSASIPEPRRDKPAIAKDPEQPRFIRDTLSDGSTGPEMVIVPAGRFLMGDIQNRGSALEQPVHVVRIGTPFAIGTKEVTFGEFDRFARATGKALPRDRGWGRGRQPVMNVSWEDATAYADWLSEQTGQRYRLPTEAEWEYAARGGSDGAYWWGNEIGERRAVCDGCGSPWDGKRTAPTGSFDANGFGLFDTVGNVWEWVQDCAAAGYSAAPADGSAWITQDCPERVFRGGGWNSNPEDTRVSKRNWDGPDLGYSYLGFRLVREADPVDPESDA